MRGNRCRVEPKSISKKKKALPHLSPSSLPMFMHSGYLGKAPFIIPSVSRYCQLVQNIDPPLSPFPSCFFASRNFLLFPPEKLPVADAVLSFIRRGGKGILGNRTDSDIVACQSGLLDFSFFIDNVSSSCANNASWQIEGSGCRNCFPKVDLV